MALNGKSALVTGSTSGIGLAIAKAFAHEGADIMLNGLGKPDEIEQIRSSLAAETGRKVLFSPADMTKPDEIAALAYAPGEAPAGTGRRTP